MSAPDDPTRWPATPPPLPPTLPADGRPTAEAWLGQPAPPPPGPPGPGAPGSPPGGGRSPRTVLVVAVVAVLVLAGGVVAAAAAITAGRAGDETAAPTTTSAPTTSTTEAEESPATTDPDADPDRGGAGAAPELEEEIAELTAFVEAERGLEFLEPVEVTVLGTDEFKTRVVDEFEAEREALEAEGALLRAAGLVPPDTDLVAAQLDLLGEGVLGFYDPTTGELVVRRDSAGPMVRSVIVHELTHALDDQHFDLDRPELTDEGDDRAWAFLALVEGSAKRVEDAYLDQLDADELDELQQEQLELGLDQIETLLTLPLVLSQLQMSPYDYGAPFVVELVDEAGQAGLDAAFAEPPASSEQVLDGHPFGGDAPVEVPAPPADGEVLADGVLGELMTGFLLAGGSAMDDLLGGLDPSQLDRLLEQFEDLDLEDLEDLLGPGGLGGTGGQGDPGGLASGFPRVATTDGWGGDRYVVWDAGGEVCVRVDWVMDTPDALAAFRGELAAWAGRDPAVVVEEPAADVARATRCAPDPTAG